MLQLVPGLLVLDESTYVRVLSQLFTTQLLIDSSQHIYGSINETARHTICSYAERVGEFTLTDDVRDGEGKLNPSVFLCLAQLQSPHTPLFPNLRRLRIVNAHHSLDYLRLFLSPSLETLEIVGLSEACRATLLSFLSATVVEVPNLSTLILGPGRLSRDVVNICLGFARLKHLELVNAVSEADHRLLKDIGRLEHLETFVIDAQGIRYAPSHAILQSEDDKRARIIAEEELCRQRMEEEEHTRCVAEAGLRHQRMEQEERERQRRFEEEVEERQRKAALPRVAGRCWRCGTKCPKKGGNSMQCKSCTVAIIELDNERRMEEEEQKPYQAVEEAWRSCEERRRCEEAMTEQRHEEEEDLYERQAELRCQESAEEDKRKENTNGFDTSATSSFPEADEGTTIDHQEETLHPTFPKLLNLIVHGSAEMMQDMIELITSASVVLLCLDMVPVLSLPSSSIATSPSSRYVGTVDSALGRWPSTLAHVTLSGLPGVASKLPDEIGRALVRLPNLEHLEVNGWDVACNIADYFVCDTGASKLKVFHLPDDANATSIPLSKLQTIAGACPNLRSLRCLLDIPTHSVPAHIPFTHLLETLVVGDSQPCLDPEAVLEVARYIDNIFPKLKTIKPPEGIAQNADQWKYIDKLVKFRQSGRRETSLGAFSV